MDSVDPVKTVMPSTIAGDNVSQVEGSAKISQLQRTLLSTNAELARIKVAYATLWANHDRLRRSFETVEPLINELRSRIEFMQGSKFWRLRNEWFALKHQLLSRGPGPEPPIDTARTAIGNLSLPDAKYNAWAERHLPRPSDVERMRRAQRYFTYRPLVSILVPVYNTPEPYLRQMIESVIDQAYPEWELCIADDNSSKSYVREVLSEYATRDERIRIVQRSENGHISAASNSALEIARGQFVGLLDHDDLLTPDALYEIVECLNRDPALDMIYSDEDKIAEDGTFYDPNFKPDWSPETFLTRMYTCHFGVYRASILRKIGGFRTEYNGSQDWDMVLRFTEQSERIQHIPQVLYHWRVHAESSASGTGAKPYAYDAGKRAVEDALRRRNQPASVEHIAPFWGNFSVRFEIKQHDAVTIIIPTRDHADDVERCINSIFAKSTYPNFQICLVDNGSSQPELKSLIRRYSAEERDRFQYLRIDEPFNFSLLNNRAVSATESEYLLFLNNDIEVINDDFIEAMVELGQQQAIGCVGAQLLYPNMTIQHAGVIIGLAGIAGHHHRWAPAGVPGYHTILQTMNNMTAVTAACLLMRRNVFDAVGGFDETLAVAYNDVDLCLRVRQAGYRNVYTPAAKLIHYESKSRGSDETEANINRFLKEQWIMFERYRLDRFEDPCYNRNLSRVGVGYDFATD